MKNNNETPEIITNVLGEKKTNEELRTVKRFLRKDVLRNELDEKLKQLNTEERKVYDKVVELKSVKMAMEVLEIRRNEIYDVLQVIYKKLNIFGKNDLIREKVNTRNNLIKKKKFDNFI